MVLYSMPSIHSFLSSSLLQCSRFLHDCRFSFVDRIFSCEAVEEQERIVELPRAATAAVTCDRAMSKTLTCDPGGDFAEGIQDGSQICQVLCKVGHKSGSQTVVLKYGIAHTEPTRRSVFTAWGGVDKRRDLGSAIRRAEHILVCSGVVPRST